MPGRVLNPNSLLWGWGRTHITPSPGCQRMDKQLCSRISPPLSVCAARETAAAAGAGREPRSGWQDLAPRSHTSPWLQLPVPSGGPRLPAWACSCSRHSEHGVTRYCCCCCRCCRCCWCCWCCCCSSRGSALGEWGQAHLMGVTRLECAEKPLLPQETDSIHH